MYVIYPLHVHPSRHSFRRKSNVSFCFGFLVVFEFRLIVVNSLVEMFIADPSIEFDPSKRGLGFYAVTFLTFYQKTKNRFHAVWLVCLCFTLGCGYVVILICHYCILSIFMGISHVLIWRKLIASHISICLAYHNN